MIGVGQQSAACAAATAQSGNLFTAGLDNVRVPATPGRDRQFPMDGSLCSGGLVPYSGLDLARTDWPVTRLTSGATVGMRYVATIPHPGTFKVYLSNPDYDPARPLTAASFPAEPLAQVTDPPLVGIEYRWDVVIPGGREGPAVLLVVWESLPVDVYYACSDVELVPGQAALQYAERNATMYRGAGTHPAAPTGSESRPGFQDVAWQHATSWFNGSLHLWWGASAVLLMALCTLGWFAAQAFSYPDPDRLLPAPRKW